MRAVRRGEISPTRAAKQIAAAPIEHLEFATLDHQRSLRAGFPEVIYAEGKTPEQLGAIVERLFRRSGTVMATRVGEAQREVLRREFPRGEHWERARMFVLRRRRPRPRGRVLVLCAGTADLPVAEEALVTAQVMGSRAELVADVGVGENWLDAKSH